MIALGIKPKLLFLFFFILFEDADKLFKDVHGQPPYVVCFLFIIPHKKQICNKKRKNAPPQKAEVQFYLNCNINYFFRAACAAASLAIGTRKGEQET